MLIKNFFDFFAKIHHSRISDYCKNLEFENFIDVGSHEGEFIQEFLKYKKIKKFYCFEPQEKIFQKLKKKLKKNKKIKYFNIALGDKVTRKKLFLSNFSPTSTLSKSDSNSLYYKFKNLIIRNNNNKNKYLTISQKTIDTVFRKISLNKTFLKIDVEGYEYNVLKGSKNKIKEIPYIIVEKQLFYQYKNNFDKVKNFLTKNNYKVLKVLRSSTLHYSDILFKKN